MKNVKDKEVLGVKKNIQRKCYHSPELSIYGTISQLTQTHQNGPTSDAGNNAMGPPS